MIKNQAGKLTIAFSLMAILWVFPCFADESQPHLKLSLSASDLLEVDSVLRAADERRNAVAMSEAIIEISKAHTNLDLPFFEKRLRTLNCEAFLVAALTNSLPEGIISRFAFGPNARKPAERFLWICVNGKAEADEELQRQHIQSAEQNVMLLSRTGFLMETAAAESTPHDLLAEGVDLLKRHDWLDGISKVSTAIESGKLTRSDKVAAYNNRGVAFMNMSNFDAAVADFSQCILLDPTNHFFYIERGAAYRLLGKRYEAITDYVAASKRGSGAKPYERLGDCYDDMGIGFLAIQCYTAAISLEPSVPGVYLKRAMAFRSAGFWRRAIADISQYLDLEKNDVEAYVLRADTYLRRNQIKEAIADCKAALKIDPNHEIASELLKVAAKHTSK